MGYHISNDGNTFQPIHTNLFIPKTHLDSNRHHNSTIIFSLHLQKIKTMKLDILHKNIVQIDYNEQNQILQIEFKLNVIHQYFEVPLNEYLDFINAENTEEFYTYFIQCKYHFDTF